MPYYHIKITDGASNSSQRKTNYELDLSEEGLKTFVEQYDTGDVLFKGKWVKSSDLEIEIRETPYVTTYIFPPLNPFTIFGTTSTFPNVTRKFIKSPPKGQTSAKSERATQPLSKNVFIVHGHDDEPKLELARMLEKLGLNPIILSEQPNKGRTIIEKLEQETLDIGYAFVILTPDDKGCNCEVFEELMEEIRKEKQIGNIRIGSSEGQRLAGEVFSRARQNVILELGYFVGKIGRNRVCCLYTGDIELPSDIHGVIFKKFNVSVKECYKGIIEELKAIGYDIKM